MAHANSFAKSTRIREVLVSDKASHVYKHIASAQACRESCSTECFTILDNAVSGFQLKIKETMYVKFKVGETYSKSTGEACKPITFQVNSAVIFSCFYPLFTVFLLLFSFHQNRCN